MACRFFPVASSEEGLGAAGASAVSIEPSTSAAGGGLGDGSALAALSWATLSACRAAEPSAEGAEGFPLPLPFPFVLGAEALSAPDPPPSLTALSLASNAHWTIDVRGGFIAVLFGRKHRKHTLS